MCVYLQNGATALIVASREGHAVVVELLIERGADVNTCMKVQYLTKEVSEHVWITIQSCPVSCVHMNMCMECRLCQNSK